LSINYSGCVSFFSYLRCCFLANSYSTANNFRYRLTW